MKKILFTVLAMLSVTTLLCAGGGGEKASPSKELTIFTWEGMFPQAILDSFEKEFGYKVNVQNFDFDETMLTKLQQSKGGDYDLVICDDYIIEPVIAEGLAQKLDKTKLTGYGNINPAYQKLFYDPQDEYTIPYGAGVQTIVYNPDAIKINITGYADLWNPALKGQIGITSNYRVINGLALKVLGQSYNTNDVKIIKEAGDRLLTLAPNIRLIKDDSLEDDLISGEINCAIMYTSQVTKAVLAKPNFKVVFPKEGIGFGTMAFFMPSKAPNAQAAYDFLNYVMDPKRGAECFQELGYYCTWSASDQFLQDKYKALLTLPAGFNENMETIVFNLTPEAQEEHEIVWTAFKAQTGK